MSDDITELPLEELLEQIQDNLYGGNVEPVVAGVHELLRRGLTPYDALTQGLIAGMDVVGEDFRTGKLFVPQVLMAAKAMKAGMEVLRPLLAETGAPRIGTLVIGTVKGDIHDLG
jgi:5-methyltetrahydrofolate--homocysteine methyltransferase